MLLYFAPMPTVRISTTTHTQLQQLAQEQGLSMKQFLRELMALAHRHHLTLKSLSELVSSKQESAKHLQLTRLVAGQASNFLDPILKKVGSVVELLEQQDPRLVASTLQTSLQRLETLLEDNAATLAAVLDD